MATQTGKDPGQDEEFLSQLYKGGELLAAGKVVEAKDHLERAFKLHPKNEKAQNLLGLTYFKLGLFDRAAEIYELLVRENPTDPTLRVNLGLVYLKTNNLGRAVKEFETSTDLEPTHKKAHNYLGLALAQSGDYARAREHFVIAGSEAMAEKMARAIAAGAKAPVAIAVAPPPSSPKPVVQPHAAEVIDRHMAPVPPEPSVSALPVPPAPMAEVGGSRVPVPPFEVLVMPETPASDVVEVTSEEDVPPDAEVIPAEALLKKPSGAEPKVAAKTADLPPPSPSSPVGKAMRNDWGAQFGVETPPASVAGNGSGDDMRFAEDEGPPAMPMPDAVATSEAAVATGAQVPVEVMTQGKGVESWEQMPVVEATAEEMMVEVDVPISAPTAPYAQPSAPGAAGPPLPPAPDPELPPGLHFTGTPPTVDVSVSEAAGTVAEAPAEGAAPVEMFPSEEPGSGPDAWGDGAAQPAADGTTPGWLTDGQRAPAGAAEGSANGDLSSGAYAEQQFDSGGPQQFAAGDAQQFGAGEEQQFAAGTEQEFSAGAEQQFAGGVDPQYAEGAQPQYADGATEGFADGADGHYAGDGVPRPYADGAQAQYAQQPDQQYSDGAEGQEVGMAPSYAEPDQASGSPAVQAAQDAGGMGEQSSPEASGFSPMAAPKLEELGPSAAQGFALAELSGPFNLSAEGLALSVNGELLSRLPGLLAVVGSVDAAPELKRSRGRTTEQPFGDGGDQLQRLKGSGVVHLEPGSHRYQAIDLADEGAYVREERVFAFEEAVAFENARLTGVGSIGVDVVHLKGQGKVLLRLDGALKAIAIPPGTPLKVPLARLVGWYGYVTVRVMGFVGQGAVELTGDGYALLSA